MNNDSWLDNVDKKIKLKWMLSYYIKEMCETYFNSNMSNFCEYVDRISIEFVGNYDDTKRKLEEAQEKDSVFNLLNKYQDLTLVKSVYEKETDKLLYQISKIDIYIYKLENEEIEKLLGYLYLKGYQNKICLIGAKQS